MLHAFTVDLEDWYQGIPVSTESRARAERRLRIGTDRLLTLLRDHGARATFFCLGAIADDHPELLREIADAGHDIGSHRPAPALLYHKSPARLAAKAPPAT